MYSLDFFEYSQCGAFTLSSSFFFPSLRVCKKLFLTTFFSSQISIDLFISFKASSLSILNGEGADNSVSPCTPPKGSFFFKVHFILKIAIKSKLFQIAKTIN